MELVKGISTRSDQQVEGGGIISSGEVEITGAQYVDNFTYSGGHTIATGLLCTMKDQEGTDYAQFWSCGDARNVKVSEEGTLLIPLMGQTGFVRTSNLGLLMASLTDAGYPLDKHPEDGNVAQLLVGLRVTIVRKTQPKREGLTQTSKSGRDLTVLLFNKVVSLPWEKKKSTTPKVTATKGKTNAAPSQEDVDEKAIEILMAIINVEGTVNQKVIGMKAYQHDSLKGDPHRNIYSGRISRPEFLDAQLLWTFDRESGDISAQA